MLAIESSGNLEVCRFYGSGKLFGKNTELCTDAKFTPYNCCGIETRNVGVEHQKQICLSTTRPKTCKTNKFKLLTPRQ